MKIRDNLKKLANRHIINDNIFKNFHNKLTKISKISKIYLSPVTLLKMYGGIVHIQIFTNILHGITGFLCGTLKKNSEK